MADLAEIKRNAIKMSQDEIPVDEITNYISSQGVTVEDVRNLKDWKLTPAQEAAPTQEAAPAQAAAPAQTATNLAEIKRNAIKMSEEQAPVTEITDYISSQGATVEDVRNLKDWKLTPDEEKQAMTAATEAEIVNSRAENKAEVSNFGSGVMEGLQEVVRGGVQTGADVAAGLFPDNKAIQDFQQLVPEAIDRGRQRFEAQTDGAISGKVGRFVGEAAPFVAAIPAGAATLTGRAGLSALGGAVAMGTAATTEQLTPEQALSNRAVNTAIGGAVGAAVPVALTGVNKFVTSGGVGMVTAKAASNVQRMASKIANVSPTATAAFEKLNIPQNLAAVSDSPAVKLYDRWISKFPGSAGVMQKNTDEILEAIEGNIKKIGGDSPATRQEAGAVIQKGVFDFTSRVKKSSEFLYDRVDRKIPTNTRVPASNTLSLLNDPQFQSDIFGKEANAIITHLNKSASTMKGAVTGVTQGQAGTIPYSELRQVRTLVGRKLSNTLLIGGEDEAALKRLYGQLSEDMKSAATNAGASKEFDNATTFYKNHIQGIEKQLQQIANKASPEDAYRAAISGTKEGGTKINQVMKSLALPEREIVRGTILHNLGKATAGQQDGAGTLFSTQTFLTNWNKIAPEAKKALFGADTETRIAIDTIATVASRLKGVERFGNPSGTAQQMTMGFLLASSMTMPLRVGGALLGANSSARLLTNPRFVKWLGKNVNKNLSPQSLNKALKELKSVAIKEKIINDDIAQYVATIGLIGINHD